MLLASTFRRFPGVRFVMLHCGIPWIEQAGIMAKYFENVYIDMAWLHVISPSMAVRGLKTWMDLLPVNKIFGFGGDYLIVEKVYGHLEMAKENLCRAIAQKAEGTHMPAKRAALWLQKLLHDNPQAVYFPEK